jgi:hypothetical protein
VNVFRRRYRRRGGAKGKYESGMWKKWVRNRVADPSETWLRKRTLTVVALDIALGIVLVGVNLMVQDLRYGIEYTNSLIDRLDREHAELLGEYERATSPERLRRLAVDRLGMVTPQPGQVRPVYGQP